MQTTSKNVIELSRNVWVMRRFGFETLCSAAEPMRLKNGWRRILIKTTRQHPGGKSQDHEYFRLNA